MGRFILKQKNKNVSIYYILLFVIAVFMGSGGSIIGLYKTPEEIDYLFIFTCVFLFFISICYVLNSKISYGILINSKLIKLILLVFISILIPTIFNGYFYYGQNLFTGFREILLHAGIVMPLILIVWVKNNSLQFISNLILLIAGYCAVIIVVTWLFPILSEQIWDQDALSRLQDIGRENRIALPQAFRHTFYYAYYYCLAVFILKPQGNSRNYFALMLMVSILLMVLFLLIDRRRFFGMVIMTVFVFLTKKYSIKKVIPLVVGGVLVVLVTLFNGDILEKQISGLVEKTTTEINDNSGAAGIRIPCANFYYKEFKKTGYIGIGAISETRVTKNFDVLKAKDQGYNYSDIGFLGILALWGGLGIYVTYSILVYTYRSFSRQKNNSNITVRICSFAGILFLLHEIITQSQFFWNTNDTFFWGLIFSQVFFLEENTRKKRLYFMLKYRQKNEMSIF